MRVSGQKYVLLAVLSGWGLVAVAADRYPPQLTFTNYHGGEVVTTPTIKLEGTATDAGYGDNGISKVTVNGVSAANGRVSGSNEAHWKCNIALVPGYNTLEVIATDNSAEKRQFTVWLCIQYQPVDDVVPDPFFFGSKSPAEIGCTAISETITITGVTVPVPIFVSEGQYQIDGGGWFAKPGSVQNGQTVTLRANAPPIYYQEKSVTLTVGGVSATWHIIAQPALAKPDYFISRVAISPLMPAAGAPFTVAITVKNMGDKQLEEGAITLFPATGSNTITQNLPCLGRNKTTTLTFEIPGQLFGPQTMRVSLAVPGDVNPVNDAMERDYTVGEPPDFGITAVRLSPSVPVSGKKFTAYVTITNLGGRANAGMLAVWTSDVAGVPPSKSVGSGVLKKGGRMTVTVASLLCTGTAGVPQTLTVMIDAGGAVDEPDETNNTATLPYTAK